MNNEEFAPGQRGPLDWVDLVAGIRAGDEEAVLRLGSIFQSAIRFFLRRGLGRHELESREQEVLSLVIRDVRGASLENPNRLASHVLTVLQQYIDSQTTAGPRLVLEDDLPANIDKVGVVRELLANIADVDREALRRYYGDNETSEQICQTLSIASAEFRALRNALRSAFMSRNGINP